MGGLGKNLVVGGKHGGLITVEEVGRWNGGVFLVVFFFFDSQGVRGTVRDV